MTMCAPAVLNFLVECVARLPSALSTNGRSAPSGRRSRPRLDERTGPGRGCRFTGLLLVLLLVLSGCGAPTGYVFQAAKGQYNLYRAERPIPEVVADPRTPPLVRSLLREVPRIKAFALEHGLAISDNYEQYVALDRPYVVWFVNASHPLAFYPKMFWFPVVGSFPGLGWFDERSARKQAAELARQGWDVSVRGVRAFSTGGWFSDPIVSSMFTESDNAFGYLANVVLHESLHATVLIPDQQFYNESLASFVGDQLTVDYLRRRFGVESEEMTIYLEREQLNTQAEQLVSDRYSKLEALYASDAPIEQKLIEKQKIMRELYVRLGFEDLPTNATLIGTRLYDVGQDQFRELLSVCGRDWKRFIAAAGSVHAGHFASPQLEDFTAIVERLIRRGCEPFPPRRPTRYRVR